MTGKRIFFVGLGVRFSSVQAAFWMDNVLSQLDFFDVSSFTAVDREPVFDGLSKIIMLFVSPLPISILKSKTNSNFA